MDNQHLSDMGQRCTDEHTAAVYAALANGP